MRSATLLAGEDASMKRKILTQSMTVMSISTRRLSEPLVNTRWRLKIILSEELHCLTKVLLWWCVIISHCSHTDKFQWWIALFRVLFDHVILQSNILQCTYGALRSYFELQILYACLGYWFFLVDYFQSLCRYEINLWSFQGNLYLPTYI